MSRRGKEFRFYFPGNILKIYSKPKIYFEFDISRDFNLCQCWFFLFFQRLNIFTMLSVVAIKAC